MKKLLTILFLGTMFGANAQTYMYIEEGEITPESPLSTSDEVFIQLIGNFSDGGAGVDDWSFSLDGTTVNLEINASSEGGIATLIPFDITYELGTYEPGEYTVEISGSGIADLIDDPLTFVVEGEIDDAAISTNQAEANIQIYPNPTSDLITINFKKGQLNNRVEILTSDSKVVLNEAINSKTTELKVSHLENGVYFVRLFDVDGKAFRTERIVITH